MKLRLWPASRSRRRQAPEQWAEATVPGPAFQADWFSFRIPQWQRLLAEFKGKPGLHFLEIGCYEGRATTWLLQNILSHPSSRITAVDVFAGGVDIEGNDLSDLKERFLAHIKPWPEQVILEVGRSQEVLRRLTGPFDFVYVDGSHDAADVLEDAVHGFRLLRLGGILIFDDYEWNYYQDPLRTPKLAVDSFLAVYKDKVEVLHKKYQVAIRKKG